MEFNSHIDEAELRSANILVIDDMYDNLRLLSEILMMQGYHVRPSPDGYQALKAALVQTPDLILLDIMMPEIDGYEVCRRLKADERTQDIPVIFISTLHDTFDKVKAFSLGGVDYITKPFRPEEVLARVKVHLELRYYRKRLEEMVKQRTSELETRNRELEKARDDLHQTNIALQEAMKNLHTTKITDGVYWLQVPEADLYLLCGCPADVVKLLMKKGVISLTQKQEIPYETGPNAILLSDILIQNGDFSNLAEFPVLQMLYRQGMLLPSHPNNTGKKPLLIGTHDQVHAQMEYIYRGNYGLISYEEILQSGVSPDMAQRMMRLKVQFAFGKIHSTHELLDTRIVQQTPVELKNGVFVERKGLNRYEFQYKGQTVLVDLNLSAHQTYDSPYQLGFHQIRREYFAVIHTGEGDGWDTQRPSMSSILVYLGKIYVIDVGPNIVHVLRALSIDISEIEGIFHTHAHDDHFAGLPTLIHSDHRIKYYATPFVRASVAKKFSALMSMPEEKFFQYFDVQDLDHNTWNDIEGLEVKPMYSPHPVETNVFVFRVLGEDGYKTYSHLADIPSFAILKKMMGKAGGPDTISTQWYEDITTNFLAPADIKKVDIGGGLIHGQAQDFREDSSRELILAHTSETLEGYQKEIGSERSFGTVDVLISANQMYLRKQAADLLDSYFPTVPFEQLRPLLNAPIVSFNPGTIIQKKGSMTFIVYLIITGTVEFIHAEHNIQNFLSRGCFIGDVSFLQHTPSSATWRAFSYVQALRMTATLYHAFLEKNGLYDRINTILDKLDFLQQTFLFGEGISYLVQNRIAQHMHLETYSAHEYIDPPDSPGLYVLKEGAIQLMTPATGEVIETLRNGEFCGEESLFPGEHTGFLVKTSHPSTVYHITGCSLLDIPIVHWKLLEIFTKRTKMSSSAT